MVQAAMFSFALIFFCFSLSFCMTKAFISNGFYAISDDEYNGGISDGTKSTFLLGTMYMHSDHLWNPSSGVRECKMFCIAKACNSFVIDRESRTCYVTLFDRCANYSVFLRRIPEYITYEVVPAEMVPPTGIKTTCHQKCLTLGNCDSCGRRYCSGEVCDICKKTCWEIPLSVTATYFWPDLRTVIRTNCNNAWQTIYRNGKSLSYGYILQFPLWLNVVIHVSDGTTYNSYFDSFTMSELTISVGNYLGGTAGNDWNAPFTNLPQVYDNETNCEPFFYSSTNCFVPQIDSIQTQIQQNVVIFKRGYVWTICGNDFGEATVLDIELRVTPNDVTFMNDSSFVDSLTIIDCTPTSTTILSTSTETTTIAFTTDATTTPVVTTLDATTTPVVTTSDATTTPVVTTPVVTTPDATTTPVVTTPDATTTLVTTSATTTAPVITITDATTTPVVTTPAVTTTMAIITTDATTKPVITISDSTTTPATTTT